MAGKNFQKSTKRLRPVRSKNGIKANARIRVEHEVDLFSKNLNLKILGQPHDEVLMTTDKRYKHYKLNEVCKIFNEGLLFRKYYGETSNAKYYQILIPKQLVDEVLGSLHGEFGKHPGTSKRIIAYLQKKYYPDMAESISEGAMSCEQCIIQSRSDRNFTNPPLQNPLEHITAPEDAMQTDLVPELPPSTDYGNIVTVLDVFSGFLFAYLTSIPEAKIVAKVLINIMFKHAYLPTTLSSDKGTVFMPNVI